MLRDERGLVNDQRATITSLEAKVDKLSTANKSLEGQVATQASHISASDEILARQFTKLEELRANPFDEQPNDIEGAEDGAVLDVDESEAAFDYKAFKEPLDEIASVMKAKTGAEWSWALPVRTRG